MDQTKRTLTKKLTQDKLSHLLLIQGHANDQSEMTNWVLEIVNEYFFNINQKTISYNNNPDILVINSERYLQKKFYDKKIIDDILQFSSHKSLVGNKKFVIIDNIKYLSEIHMNKLLKTFEEPPIAMNIFIINPDGLKAIQTVISRAVLIHYPVKSQINAAEIKEIEKLKDMSLHKFIEKVKKEKALEDQIAQYIMQQAVNIDDLKLIDQLSHYLKLKTHDQQYNYSPNERIVRLHQCIKF